MATVDMTSGTAGVASLGSVSPVLVERYVNLADAVTTKGSALASGDVLQVIDLPKGVMVFGAGCQCDTVMSGTAADLTVDLGITGGDVDRWTDAWDFDAASAGDYGTQGVAGYEPYLNASAADTMDILLTFTNTVTAGVIRVWAWIGDCNGKNVPGTASAGS